MKRFLLVGGLYAFFLTATYGQQPYLGVQNSPRKGMVNALMNPAEISNLSKKVEVNLFSLQAAVGNNILSFNDLIGTDSDILELAVNRADGPINLRTDISVIGPSAGFSVRGWSFGIATQAFVKADIVDFNHDLANSLFGENGDGFTSIAVNVPHNQRISATGWSELDLLVGREIIRIGPHRISGGANFRLIFPSAYANLGVGEIRGSLVEEGTQVYLTDTRGSLNIAYSDPNLNEDFTSYSFKMMRLAGFAMDLGGNYQWKKPSGKDFLNAGLSIRNLGGMSYSGNHVNRSYSINIPANERFRIDNLEGDLDEIEQQLVASGYFNITPAGEKLRVNLPTLLNLYAEISPVRLFQASLFIQKRLSDESSNNLITSQNMVVLTPRLVLGKFQVYSPWAHNQVSGLTGGLGLQLGGFYIGSNALLTGTLANSMQADFHMGFSFGIGNKTGL